MQSKVGERKRQLRRRLEQPMQALTDTEDASHFSISHSVFSGTRENWEVLVGSFLP